MSAPEKLTYLVRHGSYNENGGGLDAAGREASERARDSLLKCGLGDRALVLCSDAPRAVETARIIAAGICATVAESKRVRIGGTDYISAVENLDDWLARSMSDAGQTLAQDQTLVVVTHAPMIAIAKGLYDSDYSKAVGFGEVYPYIHGSWQNPGFISAFTSMAERKIAS